MANIAILGTGLLGSAFAEAAARRGDTVTVWNRSLDKAEALKAFGAIVARSPSDAVRRAARVHIFLKDDAVVEEVLASARSALLPDALVLDHTTTLPASTAARAVLLNSEGVNYLHCPVFMSPAAARLAQGSMMVAGPEALFERARGELARMTGRLEYLGARPDLAAVNKLLGNAMIIGLSSIMADVMTIAKASHLQGADAIKLLGLLDLNATAAKRGESMAKGNFAASFELAMARKDVGLMLETADDCPLAVLPAVAKRMDQLIAQGYGAEDLAVLGIDALQPVIVG